MVRGNWQRRVENAEARRQDAKQRKQRSGDKKVHKGWFQDSLDQLDRLYEEVILFPKDTDSFDRSGTTVLHVWSDAMSSCPPAPGGSPSNSKAQSGKSKKSQTDVAENEQNVKSGRRGKGRSDSIDDTPRGKKKIHPRSREMILHSTESDGSSEKQSFISKKYFLHGKVEKSNGGKKGTTNTPFVHPEPGFVTLALVLKKDDDAKAEITAVEEALLEATPEATLLSNPDAMGTLYYCGISLCDLKSAISENTDNNEKVPSLSGVILAALSNKQISMSSVVYVVLNHTLIFDRNQEGVLLSDKDFLIRVVGDTVVGSRRRSSVASDKDVAENAVRELPAAVLEHTLEFLPDVSVATCSQVCKAWNREIGRNSPNLWQHLLQRRNWPLPSTIDPEPSNESVLDHNNCERYRNQFLDHYCVMRDARALSLGVTAITTRHACTQDEMTYQDFSKRKHAPNIEDACVALLEWSPKHVLAAYSNECSLRLFEAVSLPGSREKRCKELVCLSVDPYRSTKKRTCVLMSVGIDEECIGCLCEVSTDQQISAATDVLVVLSRDDFLMGDSADAIAKGGTSHEADLKVIDIGEAVLNFVLSTDVDDPLLLPLFDFLSDGGETNLVSVSVCSGLASCGYGRFMVEVSISMPFADNNGATELLQLDRKLVLFSAEAGAIVWIQESYPQGGSPPPREVPSELSSVHQRQSGSSHSVCTVSIRSALHPEIQVCEITSTGHVQEPHLIQESVIVRNELLQEGWSVGESHSLVATTSVIIAVDFLKLMDNEEVKECKSVLSFYPCDNAVGDLAYEMTTLPGLCVKNLVLVRDQYLVVLCDAIEVLPSGVLETLGASAIVVHIPSRRQIGVSDLDTAGCDGEGLVFSAVSGGTVGLAIKASGVVLTGSNIRSDESDAIAAKADDDKSSKKKKKSKTKRSGKKDVFARGMSLRG